MKRTFTCCFIIALLSLPVLTSSQSLEFFLSNKVKFLNSNNDSITYPFIGGFIAPQFSSIDLNGDNVKDLLVYDRSGGKVLTFLNNMTAGQSRYIHAPQFEDRFPQLGSWVLLRDYNCDGKEDIFTATEFSGVSIYKNTSSNGNLQFTHVVSDLLDINSLNIYVLLLDIPVIDDMDGDGDLDIMAFGVLGGYVEYYRNQRVEDGLHCDSIRYKFVDYCWGSFLEGGLTNQIFLGQSGCGGKYYAKTAAHSGSTILSFDADQDGDKELLVGDVDYPTMNYLVNGKKEFNWPWDTVSSWSGSYPSSKPVYIDKYPAAYYVDVDGDGIKDLIATSNEPVAASNLDQVWWYKNKGQNNNPNFEFRDSNFLQDLTIDFGSGTLPQFFDADGDGDQDLLVSNRGNYRLTLNKADRVALFTNTGSNASPVFKLTNSNAFNLLNDSIPGLKLTFGDLDNDGLKDLICGRSNGKLSYYKNTGSASNPVFTLQSDNYAGIQVGNYSSPCLYDLNSDNLLDLVIGTNAGIIQYFINKGTASSPSFNAAPDIDSLGKILVNAFFWSPVYDSVFNIIDSTKTYEFEGFADPFIAFLDGDTIPELVVGSKSGKVFIYRVNLQYPDSTFEEVTDYYQSPLGGNKKTIDFGARTSPTCFDVNNDGRPDIILGNSRGGLHFLSSKFTPLDTLPPSGLAKYLPVNPLSIYPNPASALLNIQSEHVLNAMVAEVYDLTGRMVMSKSFSEGPRQHYVLPVDGLADGSYILRVHAEGYATGSEIFVVIR